MDEIADDIPCDDFLHFSKLLHAWRKSDDRINNELNAALPTASFSESVDAAKQCSLFFDKLTELHKRRFTAIKRCIDVSTNRVNDLKQRYEKDPTSTILPAAIRKEQLQLRQFKSETLEEEIIQNAALKVLYERCRDHFSSPMFEKFKRMPEVRVPALPDLLEAADNKFIELFGCIPSIRVVAPGRVNLMGEHTDYNEGYVLPMALPMVTVMVSRPKGGEGDKGICCIHTMSEQEGELSTVTFNLTGVEKKTAAKGERWSAYIRGVIAVFQQSGAPRLPAFNAVVVSSVPIGEGLSSSASLEVATLLTCQKLTDFDNFSLTDSALICQRAEHEWAGSPCGLMDQLACLGGVRGHALFIDCRSNHCESVKMDFEGKAKVVIVASGVHHRIAAGQYRIRRSECEELAKYFKVSSLRDLQKELPRLEELCAEACEAVSLTSGRRLHHILTENQRVLDAVDAMTTADCMKLGQLMQQSHTSMKCDYEVSCEEVDHLIDICMSTDGVYGARMTGGGFGGSLVVLIKPDAVSRLITAIDSMYSRTANIYVADASLGAHILPKNKERTKSTSKCNP
ncbi:Galactokinase [Echinococcus granulosus]|nr:Galactokinase [Echinococcus granulosus]